MLQFTAQIRLPESMSEMEKRDKIDEIVENLDMKKCLNTSKLILDQDSDVWIPDSL